MSDDRSFDWVRANPIKTWLIASAVITTVALLSTHQKQWVSIIPLMDAWGVLPTITFLYFVSFLAIGFAVGILILLGRLAITAGLLIYQRGIERGHPRWGAVLGIGIGMSVVVAGLTAFRLSAPWIGKLLARATQALFGGATA